MRKIPHHLTSLQEIEDKEESIKNAIEFNTDYEKLNKFEHVLESRLASYNVTTSLQLVMKKEGDKGVKIVKKLSFFNLTIFDKLRLAQKIETNRKTQFWSK